MRTGFIDEYFYRYFLVVFIFAKTLCGFSSIFAPYKFYPYFVETEFE